MTKSALPARSDLPLYAYLLLALLSAGLFLPGFSSLPPFDRDEARFAQASSQMLDSGNYVDIRFQEETRYKKPVGIYWLQSASTALASAVVGDSKVIWTYRIRPFSAPFSPFWPAPGLAPGCLAAPPGFSPG